ncbi:hypothetical protein [Rugamonas rubra]|nr:hypothetical protein [Rugamonas rubra]
MLADREGRLEDRPKRIKGELLPYDSVDVEPLLIELELHGFILRYVVGSNRFIQICKFAEHQSPHVREQASAIPGPGEALENTSKAMPSITKDVPSIALDDDMSPPRSPDSLIPDSLFSDSPITAATPGGVVVASFAADQRPARSIKPDCPHQEIIAIYHELLPQCPQVRDWTTARATQLRARWNEDEKRQSLGYWRSFFEYVGTCDFLVGRSGKSPFFADLEWMTKSSNFTKIREQKYENRN